MEAAKCYFSSAREGTRVFPWIITHSVTLILHCRFFLLGDHHYLMTWDV